MTNIKKILIANRGEIACRVIKSARKMGIKTVAVYSDADRNALHVEMADEAVHIGPPPAAESYIVIDKILDAIKQTGADAVHPGYGFLSERAEFAEALEAMGVAFIGPPAGAIEAMGDKITSKKLAAEAGVSTVPGYMGLIDDAEHAVKIAAEIGYPVMIKASAGGGGKGMRIAWNDEEAREGFQLSKNEAASSFGDDRIFIEKFVTQPRHIEIQVLGDKHGNCIYLNERECSIQRRNQKVIEEAPSPFLDPETRRVMGKQAVALAKAVGYCSAGTVEFIVSDGWVEQEHIRREREKAEAEGTLFGSSVPKIRPFYFLEMNTRLQVEHPVTELITGVDLVEQMIKVANGQKLELAQDDIGINGWALESRLYAEDPFRNFLPSIGRLTRYRPPAEVEGRVRNDTGVYEGGEISMYYDPMIAKLCTWGENRGAAIEEMRRALDAFEVEGIGHNLPFLSAVYDHDRFISGNITTAFIAEEYPDGFEGAPLHEGDAARLAAIATACKVVEERRAAQTSGTMDGRPRAVPVERVVTMAEMRFETSLEDEGDWLFRVTVNGAQHLLDLESWCPGDPLIMAGIDGERMAIKSAPSTDGYVYRYRGAEKRVFVRTARAAELAEKMPEKLPPDTSKMLLCPMPGLVVSIAVAEGDEVQEGQALCTVEAMKMENVLRAEKKAVVSKINAEAGASLAVDDIIMEFE